MKEKFRSKLLWVADLILWVGILYFGIMGVLILTLRTTSPMMGVTLDSMTHPDNSWRNWYEEHGHDSQNFPFQEGIQEGDMVVLEGASWSNIKIGDVIVWERESGRRIIHRVGEKGKDSNGYYMRTRSDKYQIFDKIIRLEDIVGKVVFSIPHLGYPSIWF